jgi:hypothetical protein
MFVYKVGTANADIVDVHLFKQAPFDLGGGRTNQVIYPLSMNFAVGGSPTDATKGAIARAVTELSYFTGGEERFEAYDRAMATNGVDARPGISWTMSHWDGDMTVAITAPAILDGTLNNQFVNFVADSAVAGGGGVIDFWGRQKFYAGSSTPGGSPYIEGQDNFAIWFRNSTESKGQVFDWDSDQTTFRLRPDGTGETGFRVEGGLATKPVAVNLTADNQTVNLTNRSYIQLSSDNGTAGNRTFVLTPNVSTMNGQTVTIEWTGTNAGEIVDDASNTGGGNTRLSGTWTPTQYDTLTLRFNGTDWVEMNRSTN